MAVSSNCTELDACREQLFSNPNINGPDGTPAGAADRNNARRLNETMDTILNHRQTDENLTIPDETINGDMVSNHLANHTITTANNTVVYEADSYGTLRAEESITLLPGFHAEYKSNLRVYLNENACEEQPELREKRN